MAVGGLSLFLLAGGLAMDATAVAAARGFAARSLRLQHVLLIALAFGGFQALMPAIGYSLGAQLPATTTALGQLLAVGLLVGIGGKMLWDGQQGGDAGCAAEGDVFGVRVIIVLAIATSIDALGAGVSLPLLGASLVPSVLTIGLVTAGLSVCGLFAGRRLGAELGHRLDAVGGVTLILIGGKILLGQLIG